jgi:methylated-DNA-protein-cysteine methyltransferase-like protein
MTPFARRVVEVVAATSAGEVLSYGEVAAQAGRPGAARAVGGVLARHPEPLPWWRVVTASGRLVPGLEAEHADRLRAEGVSVRDGRVRPGRGPEHRGAEADAAGDAGAGSGGRRRAHGA